MINNRQNKLTATLQNEIPGSNKRKHFKSKLLKEVLYFKNKGSLQVDNKIKPNILPNNEEKGISHNLQFKSILSRLTSNSDQNIIIEKAAKGQDVKQKDAIAKVIKHKDSPITQTVVIQNKHSAHQAFGVRNAPDRYSVKYDDAPKLVLMTKDIAKDKSGKNDFVNSVIIFPSISDNGFLTKEPFEHSKAQLKLEGKDIVSSRKIQTIKLKKENTFDFIDNARTLHKQTRDTQHDETTVNTLINNSTDPNSRGGGAVSNSKDQKPSPAVKDENRKSDLSQDIHISEYTDSILHKITDHEGLTAATKTPRKKSKSKPKLNLKPVPEIVKPITKSTKRPHVFIRRPEITKVQEFAKPSKPQDYKHQLKLFKISNQNNNRFVRSKTTQQIIKEKYKRLSAASRDFEPPSSLTYGFKPILTNIHTSYSIAAWQGVSKKRHDNPRPCSPHIKHKVDQSQSPSSSRSLLDKILQPLANILLG